jgi:hypothetical protein
LKPLHLYHNSEFVLITSAMKNILLVSQCIAIVSGSGSLAKYPLINASALEHVGSVANLII